MNKNPCDVVLVRLTNSYPERTKFEKVSLWFTGALCLILMAGLGTLRAQPVECVPSPEGMIGFWRGNTNVNDALGKMNGEPTSEVAFAQGLVQEAFLFDGTQDTIFLPNSTNLWLTDFTIEAWIKPVQATGNLQMLFMRGDNRFAADPYFLAITSGGQFQLHVENAQGHILNLYGGTVTPNTWQHIAGTLDKTSGLLTLYKNGGVVAQQTTSIVPFGPLDSSAFVTIGSLNQMGYFYGGLLDELSLYKRALSQSEILGIVQAAELGKCQPESSPRIRTHPKNQVGYWGQSATFSVQVVGEPPLSYQWYKDTFPISWGTNAILTLSNLELTDPGEYSVVVTNSYGSAPSNPARLTVNPAGVSIALYSGITIEGTIGKRFGLQYTTNLTLEPAWLPLETITLPVSPYLWMDTNTSVNATERRFYRVIPVP